MEINILKENVGTKKGDLTGYLMLKRIIDFCLALIALVVLFPVFLVIVILIKLEDGGVAIYRHQRIGLNGQAIGVYKFRSMKIGADDLEAFLTPEQLSQYRKEFKLDFDPRITKIGNFLRKSSLDELPQLLNIIKSEMSLVGPRPIMEEELEWYTAKERKKLLSTKPGLTGYWQAYARNNATYESGERQRMEIYYTDNASMGFDFRIIRKTTVAVLKQSGK
jgi:lipopolysaccharide/colanic/teichoic acid biosynthesis glycosyltransferase